MLPQGNKNMKTTLKAVDKGKHAAAARRLCKGDYPNEQSKTERKKGRDKRAERCL